MEVRPMGAGDWEAVRAIFAAGLATGDAAFEEEPPGWPDFRASYPPHLCLVAVEGRDVLGWAAASPLSDRCALEGVAEDSVYVAPGAQGRGVGRALLDALVRAAEEAGIWTLQAGIFPENEASLALHQACGFRVVGRRQQLGCHRGRWRDVLLLERRSPIVGRTGSA
jgi:phosphinothricin acetyltransferase